MIRIDDSLRPADLQPALARVFAAAKPKIRALDAQWDPGRGTPVFTVRGKYTSRGWTEWTQGFQYGCPLLVFEATGDEEFLTLGREKTRAHMAPHVTHIGVHDHGFNTISTYGNLWRMGREGRLARDAGERDFYELAIMASGAVQAARWTRIDDGTGFIHSFNGPHSLFSDTIRSCRVLMLAHQLGHVLMGEHDARISLRERAEQHLLNTARYNVYYGEGRDCYDTPGRVVHESIFNTTDGRYRCPSTQQGYTPFSTWTRGLAWVVLGAAEELECFRMLGDASAEFLAQIERMARVTAEFYLAHTPTCGVPYWDTGAPGLVHLGDYLNRPAEPDNPYEPVDSSAAAITAQGLLRLGDYLGREGAGARYWQAGLTVARTLFGAPYLSEDPQHQGLLLHSVYHRPNGWDHVPAGKHVPMGEACMWGDYHALELAVYLHRVAQGGAGQRFF